MNVNEVKARRAAALATPTTLDSKARQDVAGALNALLADFFALYIKTKNFHWHISGPHFRDYHLLLDEQAQQLYGATDTVAERVRKLGATTLHSIGHIARLQHISDNDADYVTPFDMLRATRGQSGAHRPDARDPRRVRCARGCCQCEPAGELDRSGRTAYLVPL